eukprot:Colp12_sorted_trinity150504_noHs@21743
MRLTLAWLSTLLIVISYGSGSQLEVLDALVSDGNLRHSDQHSARDLFARSSTRVHPPCNMNASVSLGLFDLTRINVTHVLQGDGTSFIRVFVTNTCISSDPQKLTHLMLTIEGSQLYSQFHVLEECRREWFWDVPTPPLSGLYSISVRPLFFDIPPALAIDAHLKNNTERNTVPYELGDWFGAMLNVTVNGTDRHLRTQKEAPIWSSLQGYWNTTDWTFVTQGATFGSATTEQHSMWAGNHFVMAGDSVTRFLFKILCDDHCSCCEKGGDLITRRWWYDDGIMHRLSEFTEEDAKCEIQPCQFSTTSYSVSPDVIYLSIGSHAPQVSATNETFSRIVNILQSIKDDMNISRIVLAATTAVNEDYFPQRYCSSQWFLRSNTRIHLLNQMAESACKLVEGCYFLDLFSPILAVRDYPGMFHAGDPIHFSPDGVRATIADIIFRRLQDVASRTQSKQDAQAPETSTEMHTDNALDDALNSKTLTTGYASPTSIHPKTFPDFKTEVAGTPSAGPASMIQTEVGRLEDISDTDANPSIDTETVDEGSDAPPRQQGVVVSLIVTNLDFTIGNLPIFCVLVTIMLVFTMVIMKKARLGRTWFRCFQGR